jgi:peptidoglycan/LPS O-acetylase OafA/YrhL
MLLLICVAARGQDWPLLAVPPLRATLSWLAGISFGIYLVHQQLGYVFARVLVDLGVDSGWVRLLAVIAAAVLAGWALTALVERPAHRALTRERGTKVAAAAGARGTSGGARDGVRATDSGDDQQTEQVPARVSVSGSS